MKKITQALISKHIKRSKDSFSFSEKDIQKTVDRITDPIKEKDFVETIKNLKNE